MIRLNDPEPDDTLRRDDLSIGDLVSIRADYASMYPFSFVLNRVYIVTSLEGFGINGVYVLDTVTHKTMPINASLLKKVDIS